MQVSIPARWGTTPQVPHVATVISLSIKGCLVQTDIVKPLSDLPIYLNMLLPHGGWMSLRGSVIYHLRGVGFGMIFLGLEQNEEDMIQEILQRPQPYGWGPSKQ